MVKTDQPFKVSVPKDKCSQQGEEIFIVNYKGEERHIRAHDYHEIYAIPNLYEYLFYDNYKCCSPDVICSLLDKTVTKSGSDTSDLTVLDVGAGNGMVGEKLNEIGVNTVLGIDIIQEAAEAAERDRPGIYEDYYIEDLTQLPQSVCQEIENHNPNCMTIVAALGFDDIPPLAFANAFNMISSPGWIAFNIKDEFCSSKDCTGFSKLIDNMTKSSILDVKVKERYQHRLCQDGTPLNYFAIVGQKKEDLTEKMLSSFS
ncbi:SAM-dependent methyltransferase [Desulfonema limicola]|uniref:SAM-dependent methyltransferase n=1 Tax=Desulfonema limicola TaxID=45656 RepID=A0A975GF91_9BACT|nr:class I SAM-dependent methyltransferase [Desulfonema limicola]QTA78988.1 SAM-dependent methyltransferase [Desulfonema limicola]